MGHLDFSAVRLWFVHRPRHRFWDTRFCLAPLFEKEIQMKQIKSHPFLDGIFVYDWAGWKYSHFLKNGVKSFPAT